MAELASRISSEAATFHAKGGLDAHRLTQLALPQMPPIPPDRKSTEKETESYHSVYSSEDGTTFYSADVSRNKGEKEWKETGFGSIIISGDLDQRKLSSGTSQIGYIKGVAMYASGVFTDNRSLAAHYGAIRRGEASALGDVQTSIEIGGPFFESYQLPLPGEPVIWARVEGADLVFERQVSTPTEQQTDVFRAPYRIDGLAPALREEGRHQVMNDTEAAGDELHEEGTVLFEVPKLYPTSYTSKIEQL